MKVESIGTEIRIIPIDLMGIGLVRTAAIRWAWPLNAQRQKEKIMEKIFAKCDISIIFVSDKQQESRNTIDPSANIWEHERNN